eukprot:CAMPEP_0197734352 /NCGR_PEP_ID=MMETSP1434-20131217/44377_1 /TAXON_ID=265543 /ORGANISM="Minutocellus polymorphus, Strain CCMP3303" /LENGTH=134 /DNA_ID=CAMNT_0043321763 /DNA_START=193 /DNA_END=598 /DNA_ORIENTATION=+
MTTTMKPPVQPFNTFSLLLLSLPTVCGGELDDMKIMGLSWPAVAVAIGNHTGNHTDPDDDDQSHANEMAANILGYTLIGIVVLMFFFTVATFGAAVALVAKIAASYFHDTAARDVADICEADGQKAEMPPPLVF